MIGTFTGKPGAGKTYGAVCRILRALRETDQFVVTNIALNLDLLNQYFQVKGRKFVDVFARVRIITKEECREFWRFRGLYTLLPAPGGECITRLSVMAGTSAGVLYVIDEAHILFDSRQWQKSSEALTFYNSQHRKLGDDVVFVTQFLKLLEVRVRGFSEFFHVFRNFAGTSFLTVLKMPRRMRELVYSVEPGPGVIPDTESWHALNMEIAALYDTMAGVGVAGGRVADARVGNKGLPWWSVFLALGGGAVAMWFLVNWGGQKVVSKITGTGSQSSPAQSAGSKFTPPGKGSEKAVPVDSKASEVPVGVYMVGYWLIGREIEVWLSDGRTLTRAELRAVTENQAVGISGEIYPLRRNGNGSGSGTVGRPGGVREAAAARTEKRP